MYREKTFRSTSIHIEFKYGFDKWGINYFKTEKPSKVIQLQSIQHFKTLPRVQSQPDNKGNAEQLLRERNTID
jgi:hypothetical protein